MRSEAYFQLTFSLADILDAAAFTCDAVDKVRAAAARVVSTHICASRS